MHCSFTFIIALCVIFPSYCPTPTSHVYFYVLSRGFPINLPLLMSANFLSALHVHIGIPFKFYFLCIAIMSSTLSLYKRLKGGIKSGLTRITKDITTFKADNEAIEAKLASVLRQLDDFNTCHREMETVYETDKDYFVDIEVDMGYLEGLEQIIVHFNT